MSEEYGSQQILMALSKTPREMGNVSPSPKSL